MRRRRSRSGSATSPDRPQGPRLPQPPRLPPPTERNPEHARRGSSRSVASSGPGTTPRTVLTAAHISSPSRACGRPNTATCRISGCRMSTSSTSRWVDVVPPQARTSLLFIHDRQVALLIEHTEVAGTEPSVHGSRDSRIAIPDSSQPPRTRPSHRGREPASPSTRASGAVRVVQALSRAVADRDIPAECRHQNWLTS